MNELIRLRDYLELGARTGCLGGDRKERGRDGQGGLTD
jgi:hypothetical protein